MGCPWPIPEGTPAERLGGRQEAFTPDAILVRAGDAGAGAYVGRPVRMRWGQAVIEILTLFLISLALSLNPGLAGRYRTGGAATASSPRVRRGRPPVVHDIGERVGQLGGCVDPAALQRQVLRLVGIPTSVYRR